LRSSKADHRVSRRSHSLFFVLPVAGNPKSSRPVYLFQRFYQSLQRSERISLNKNKVLDTTRRSGVIPYSSRHRCWVACGSIRLSSVILSTPENRFKRNEGNPVDAENPRTPVRHEGTRPYEVNDHLTYALCDR